MFATHIPIVSQLVEGANIILDGYFFLPLPQANESTARKTLILTQHILCASAWVATVTAVASIALGNLAVTLLAAAFAATAVTASYFAKDTYELRTIEQDAANLRSSLRTLQETIGQYKKENQELKETEQKLNADIAALGITKVELKKENEKTATNLAKFETENSALRKTLEEYAKLPDELAKQLDLFGTQISQIQGATKLADESIQKALEETGNNVVKQTKLLQDTTSKAVQAEQFLAQTKELLANISALYGQSINALKAATDAEQKINEEFKKWKIDELAAAQDKMAQILADLDKSLKEANKALEKPKGTTTFSLDNVPLPDVSQESLLAAQASIQNALAKASEQIQALINKCQVQKINQLAEPLI